jgi:F420H(2)-dependent quinone reductase
VPSPPAFPPPGTFRAKIVNAIGSVNVAAYKLSGGRLGGKMDNLPVLILEHTGRKSGTVREAPLLYLGDGQDLVIVASRGGSDATPAWWLNLQAHPQAAVTIGREKRGVVARIATDEERTRLWPELVRGYRHYEVYQSRTQRRIPVIILSPA